jgi:hypothetical protein
MELNYWTETTVKSATFDPKKKGMGPLSSIATAKVTLRPSNWCLRPACVSRHALQGMKTFKGEHHRRTSWARWLGKEGRRHRLEKFGARHLRGCRAGVDATMV